MSLTLVVLIPGWPVPHGREADTSVSSDRRSVVAPACRNR
jgi:hypothetical protein